MPEEVYGKTTMKLMQFYRWHKHGFASVNNPRCGQLQAGDTQGLVHCKFIAEECTVNKEIYIKMLHLLGDAMRRKRPRKWVWNTWFLLGIFPELVTTELFFSVSVTKKCSKSTVIHEHWGSRCNESTDRSIKKLFLGMLPKTLWTLKEVSLHKGTTLKEMLCTKPILGNV
jgi:hypothetical protein